MNIHQNARLTPHGRERLVEMNGERANAGGRRTSCRRLPADGQKMACALQDGGRIGPG
jgi:hypothetical protein